MTHRRIITFAVVLASSSVNADPAAEAIALHDQGVKDLQAGNTEIACKELAASLAKAHDTKTLGQLAKCNTKLGKVVTAWRMWREVVDAPQLEPAFHNDAVKNMTALEPRLPRFVLVVKPGTNGMEISVNGERVDPSVATPLPIDPGPMQVIARAPGHVEWSGRYDAIEGKVTTVEVPELAIAPDAPVTAPPASGRLIRESSAAHATSQLQITVAERGESYEVEVVTTGGTLRCAGAVTHDEPCKLTAPPGPTVMNVRGAAALREELTLKGKPVLISLDRTSRYLLYGGLGAAGAGAVGLGVGLYACSQRNAQDVQSGSATGLACLVGTTVGGVALLAGGVMVVLDLMSDRHAVNVRTDDDDEQAIGDRRHPAKHPTVYTTSASGGAVVGVTGSF